MQDSLLLGSPCSNINLPEVLKDRTAFPIFFSTTTLLVAHGDPDSSRIHTFVSSRIAWLSASFSLGDSSPIRSNTDSASSFRALTSYAVTIFSNSFKPPEASKPTHTTFRALLCWLGPHLVKRVVPSTSGPSMATCTAYAFHLTFLKLYALIVRRYVCCHTAWKKSSVQIHPELVLLPKLSFFKEFFQADCSLSAEVWSTEFSTSGK